MATERQILANRENAKKSTGPSNISITKFNAMRHGMTSKQPVMLPHENREEFDALFQSIRSKFHPHHEFDDEFALQISLVLWRLIRGWLAEQILINEFTDLEGIRWDDLLQSGYLLRIQKYELRLTNQLYRLLKNFKRLSATAPMLAE
ncbi:MAG: hypothetical protein DWB56_08005 [Candidatus Jettenia sp.]|uniref:Uncharacterized protein n=1 Tax=Candidatus Jettenia caeni TaxID=247490 RepID=I3IJD9_9BACT|nr:hypothetical protein [Candidatus Jettenia sp. AMX1]MBC6928889.1 hypothetical protein [Candidatus Jettenia sp.]GAB61834.1 hypothetical protein KSU1_C0238 [Candidatus Jettenia caeni]KAA0250867.1 MAG: hypothetical protein EDM77_03410 [Candidatus Jettenia sp. AMX1]MCE7879890.1 hypothetical protein [Candidatus Jettenia sp. AMX1]MCQ3926669.1 hypothetical protein [Candidatus Jettenia sp.]